MASSLSASTNIPEFSVSALSNALKQTLEERFALVKVRGEISNFKGPHSSGHSYFRLKDDHALLEAVIWRGVYARLRIKPQEGMDVIATGKITTFAGKSSYQIIIETLEPAGIGAIMAMLEERKVRLRALGIFEDSRKRVLPRFPATIGVITSPTGAVIRDIVHRLAERWPCHVLVWPVRVQGEGSADEIFAAICGFNRLPQGWPRPDVLIVARGGGSLEDLLGFSAENVVMAAAESAIVLISAVGHETDTTLIDFAADRRAPTPTAAAELATPVRALLLADIAALGVRLASRMVALGKERRLHLEMRARALPDPVSLVQAARQRLDFLDAARSHGQTQVLAKAQQGLSALRERLLRQSPLARLARLHAGLEAAKLNLKNSLRAYGQRLDTRFALATQKLSASARALVRVQSQANLLIAGLAKRQERAMAQARNAYTQRLAAQSQLLLSLGYKSVLSRGYAVVRANTNAVIASRTGARNHDQVTIEWQDGTMPAILTSSALDATHMPSVPREGSPSKPITIKREDKKSQGRLF